MIFEMMLFGKNRMLLGHKLALISVLLMLLLAASACQPSIQVLPPTLPVATVTPSAHAVAIVGVDFDPPLSSLQALNESGVRLLVAVENQGQYPESNLEVTALLSDPNDPADARSLLNETVVIESLAPGEIRLVRFSPVTALPIRGQYTLMVELTAVAGDLALQDNSRTYEIIVNAAE